MTVTLNYTVFGHPITEWDVEHWWNVASEHIRNGTDATFDVSTDLPINRARVAIAEGEVKHTDLVFQAGGVPFEVNEYGACPDWPGKAMLLDVIYAERIMTGAMKLRHAKLKARKNGHSTVSCN